MIEHFIVTRFNLSLGRTGKRNVDPEWLDRRFEIFEKYCFPSVRAQSEQNFKWLVFFDRDTPSSHRKKINKYALWENFIPIYVDHDYKLLELLKGSVLANLSDDTTHIITTRLDNDDAIYVDFVKEIKKCFQAQSFQYVSFPDGYVLKSGQLYRFHYPGNPFNSLIEKVRARDTNGIRTCFGLRHEQTANQALFISAPPAWMQVIHGENIANRTRGFRQFVVAPEEITQSFALDQSCISVDHNRFAYYLCLCQDTFWTLVDIAIMQFNRHQLFRDFLSRSMRQSIKKRLLRI